MDEITFTAVFKHVSLIQMSYVVTVVEWKHKNLVYNFKKYEVSVEKHFNLLIYFGVHSEE